HPQFAAAGEVACKPDGEIALGYVEKERGAAGRPAGRAQHVGSPDVSASRSANVAARFPFHEQKSKWDGADEVARHQGKSRHHYFEIGNSESLVYTEPDAPGLLWYRKKRSARKEPNSGWPNSSICLWKEASPLSALIRASVRCGV